MALGASETADARRGQRILVYGASGSMRHRGRAAGQALRRPRHRGVQHEERRARALARGRRGRSTTCRRTSRRTARRTTSSSTRSASTRSGAAGARWSRAASTSRPTRVPGQRRPAGLAAHDGSATRRWCSTLPKLLEGGRPLPEGAHRGGRVPGGHRSDAIRSRTWSRRPGTSRRGRRPETSSSP